MTRITNSLFESIRQVTNPVLDEGKAEEVEIVYEANIEPTSAKSRSHISNLSNPIVNGVTHQGKEIGLITKQSNGQYHAHHSAAKLAHAQSGTFDSKDKAHQFIRDAHAKAIKNGTLKANKMSEAKAEGGRVDGAHFCATHVEHSLYGEGECISEQHAKPNEDGTIDWYNVKFADGNVRKIQTEAVKVKKAKMHEHATPEGDTIEEKQLHPNQQVLDVHEPEKDKLTAKDFEMLRKGKKAKTVKEDKVEEGMPGQVGHAGKVTMKQIAKSSASPTVKKAIGKAAPDIKSYGDRAAAFDAAGIKRESVEEAKEHSWIYGNLKKVHSADRKEKLLASGALHQAVGHKEFAPATKDSIKDPKIVHFYDIRGKTGSHVHVSEEIEESVSETIVKHNDFTIEITDNPTFGDFLRAVQSIVRTDEESMQKEIVAIAEQAFAENYEEVIIEAFTRMEIEDKIGAHRKAGNTVSNDKFSTKNGQPYAEYVVTDQEGGRKKYIHHGTVRRMESMPSATKKDKE